MLTQKQLYLHNIHCNKIDVTGFDSQYREFESRWVSDCMQSFPFRQDINQCSQLIDAINTLVLDESKADSESIDYVTNDIQLDEFRILIQEFALDGLTEAQSFYYIMPRLPLSAQLPMLRILIDEFGSANSSRMHTALYIQLLNELGLPANSDEYLDQVSEASFAFINQFYWLTLRAEDPSYFAGAITYLESVIPFFFPCYVSACRRLNIAAHHYYSEHCHIDTFHALEGQRVLKAMAHEGCLDVQKAWAGVCFTQRVTLLAFESAVTKARKARELDHATTAA